MPEAEASEAHSLAAEIDARVAACPIGPWTGTAWRCHSPRYRADDVAGSLKSTGRYHRGADLFPEAERWSALYTGLSHAIVLGEKMRHSIAMDDLVAIRISELRISLESVMDACLDADASSMQTCFGPDIDAFLCQPGDYSITHRIAQAVRARAEALRIPSCTRFPGGNLIIFPDRLHPTSTIEIVSAFDPELRP